jgi:hypothetical protein
MDKIKMKYGHWFQMRDEVKQYQTSIASMLSRIYPQVQDISIEWIAMLPEEIRYEFPRDSFRRRMYSPIVDIAVGPFATEGRLIQEYDSLMDYSHTFIEELIALHNGNIRSFESDYGEVIFERLRIHNQNARCLLAIEIEKGNPQAKYLMGSAVNACALGRIGIIIAWNSGRLESYFRIREYLMFLRSLEKNSFDTTNLLILTKDQFQQAVEQNAA